MPALIKDQPSRFATILFYLNDDMEGGETSFPRWMNAETREALIVKPERGKAILFYNLLPDGNYDERSQHAALPVVSGEKVRSGSKIGHSALTHGQRTQLLINLWVWDPVLDQYVADWLLLRPVADINSISFSVILQHHHRATIEVFLEAGLKLLMEYTQTFM